MRCSPFKLKTMSRSQKRSPKFSSAWSTASLDSSTLWRSLSNSALFSSKFHRLALSRLFCRQFSNSVSTRWPTTASRRIKGKLCKTMPTKLCLKQARSTRMPNRRDLTAARPSPTSCTSFFWDVNTRINSLPNSSAEASWRCSRSCCQGRTILKQATRTTCSVS